MPLSRCLNIADLREAARRRAHRMVFDYIDGGADDEVTLAWNSDAFGRYAFHHRVLTGVAAPDLSTTLLGQRIGVPFVLSPSAGNRLFHTDGERGPARAAAKYETVYALSTLSSVSIEEIGTLTSGPKWFQLYVWKDKALVKEMLDRAKAAGYEALVLTVDLAVAGNRERDPRNQFTVPPKITLPLLMEALRSPAWTRDYLKGPAIGFANLSKDQPAASLSAFVDAQLDATFSWSDAEWVLGEWGGPAVLKGVMRADDAKRAVASGFPAIAISNHGGRQLDFSPAPVTCIAPIREAIGGDADLICDGGVRRGTDVLKAIALGANAVSFARPYLYGLAAGGTAGAIRALDILVDEIRRDMILVGAASIDELTADLISSWC
ncbi:MAG: alpha-hydroxy acid oxidase [Pseudomonadota bacterium]